jgi:limonene-1,2-epoxide hydrolase
MWIAGTYTLYMFYRIDDVQEFVDALRREDFDAAIAATGMSESEFHTRTTRVRKLWAFVGDYSPTVEVEGEQDSQVGKGGE